MRRALLTAVAVVLLAGCSDDGTTEPEAEPSAAPTTSAAPAPTQGPAVGGATVPLGAFLSAGDLGDDWRAGAAVAAPCRPTFARKAIRSVGLVEERGTLTETIATDVDIEATVKAWASSLQACGYDVQDDALGEAGLAAVSDDGEDRVLVTGVETVLIVMHARGDLAEAGDELESWADMALGTSCVAAPDGCH